MVSGGSEESLTYGWNGESAYEMVYEGEGEGDWWAKKIEIKKKSKIWKQSYEGTKLRWW